ncbi:hypothetical protein BDK51DRAFT_29790 [Blyttiomyces helicus]|uniref:Uncharacterized protein n=1 Tax=Blyttiomyces helicus TaxID=388810 RepID=A0A4P9W3G6_9FUNG|nr:hypothetical protein BDK51DRAFT_29790 [Blyttiomyces helicus]|eukprot:RKO85328.1 hypothetical protein BDK51DRAFT_29790 [Blyttiomyces helicus]
MTPSPVLSPATSRRKSPAFLSTSPQPGVQPPPTRRRPANSRTTTEHPAACRHCSTPIGTVLFFGLPAALETPHTIEVVCLTCSPSQEAAQPSLNYPARARKREEEDGPMAPFECECCKRVKGRGGVRAGWPDDRSAGWASPEFGFELLCAECSEKYAFCSECGSGGRHRTGKYRPKELFLSRRTCSLSHSRAGDLSSVQKRVFTAQELVQLSNFKGFFEDMKDLFFDTSMSQFALAKRMEHTPVIGTWSAVCSVVDAIWAEIETCTQIPSTPDMTRYIAVAWTETSSARGRAHRHAAADRLTANCTVVALQFAEWRIPTGLLFWGVNVGRGRGTSTTGPSAPELRTALVDLIVNDTKRRDADPADRAFGLPWTIAWGMRPIGMESDASPVPGRRSHTGGDIPLRRVGLTPLSENPDVDPALFGDLFPSRGPVRCDIYMGKRQSVAKGWNVQRNRQTLFWK